MGKGIFEIEWNSELNWKYNNKDIEKFLNADSDLCFTVRPLPEMGVDEIENGIQNFYKENPMVCNQPNDFIIHRIAQALSGKLPQPKAEKKKWCECKDKGYVKNSNYCSLCNKPIKPHCGICGSRQVYIRGKYPHTPDRLTCPTCCQEKLDQIREISDKDYRIFSSSSSS